MKIDINSIECKDIVHNYKIIGEGSGRIVYDLNNGYVLKSAKNKKGLSQNKVEHNLSLDNTQTIFAKVVDFSNDFRYIIMEKADKLRSFGPIFNYFKVKNTMKLIKTKDIQDIICKYNLDISDISSLTSWGIVNGIPKIIDYGLTDEVFKELYLKERVVYLLILMFLM